MSSENDESTQTEGEEPPKRGGYGILFWIVAAITLAAASGFLGIFGTLLATK